MNLRTPWNGLWVNELARNPDSPTLNKTTAGNERLATMGFARTKNHYALRDHPGVDIDLVYYRHLILPQLVRRKTLSQFANHFLFERICSQESIGTLNAEQAWLIFRESLTAAYLVNPALHAQYPDPEDLARTY
ncbi:hypothetical protein WKW50_23550 [Ochrobactrum sp. GPK 3]|uniref:hypothetical protein n=1 Tax=Brucella sp. 22210 TaxID=3453892 RepID=UPI0031385B5F